MPRIQLREVAQARCGDKGNKVNIGLFAPDEEYYEIFKEKVTSEKVKSHFEGLVNGEVIRYELPNIHAFNFVCMDALDGGGSASIRVDNLGKCFSSNLLRFEIEVPDALMEKRNHHEVNPSGL
ncbi:hypothetical protein C8P63_106124 [Melghirimyces profundicolus]|uniref:AtuA-like ferredoxin-fold domain-containing protein n=1 Tax=Melghirimyces profundicolus TaxID=1242148 RepID=A0A2T6C0Q3_9BACL|nr:hypothetical protein [Melghirimyces profundicolus]PTX61872.1 hypothetical protein C8P63_106124 [Melghirimyces profundicolus]